LAILPRNDIRVTKLSKYSKARGSLSLHLLTVPFVVCLYFIFVLSSVLLSDCLNVDERYQESYITVPISSTAKKREFILDRASK